MTMDIWTDLTLRHQQVMIVFSLEIRYLILTSNSLHVDLAMEWGGRVIYLRKFGHKFLSMLEILNFLNPILFSFSFFDEKNNFIEADKEAQQNSKHIHSPL